jgi:hypothetical protein
VDRHVRERLAKLLAKKVGRGGHRRERYTVVFFAELRVYQLNGTVKWYTTAPIATP